MVFIVDAHVLIWLLEGNERLSLSAREILTNLNSRIVLPTIVLAEIAYLYARKRISANVRQVLSEVANAENCTVYPLDEQVVTRIPESLELHDGIVVATALVYRELLGKEVAIITKDRTITESGIVPVVW